MVNALAARRLGVWNALAGLCATAGIIIHLWSLVR
jgi:hypothetical protein